MTVPARFKNAKITDWDKDHPISVLCYKYLNNFDEYFTSGKAPLLVGESGVGKTHAVAAIINTIEQGSNIGLDLRWFSASECFNGLLDYKDLWLKDHYLETMGSLKSADIVVLDDISTLRSSPRLLEYFWVVIDSRYCNLRPTIMTANFKFEVDTFWKDMEQWFSAAIARRLHESSEGLTLLI